MSSRMVSKCGEIRIQSTDGSVSISLNDSWTGKQLLELIDHDYNNQHMTSQEFQMRYQQKQREEMERKRNEYTRATVPGHDLNESNKIQIGNGKVRQMFDERRQRVTGIDKSYPLQPISSKVGPNHSGRQTKITASIKRSINPNQNGFFDNPVKMSTRSGGSNDIKHFPQATTITTNNLSGKNASSSKLSDIDYIENEQVPDIFSQLDHIDSLDSGRKLLNMDRQMTNLSVSDKNSNGNRSANIKLAPVITKKTISHNSANSLNTLKRLPPQSTKVRSIPITPEKSSMGQKSESSWPVSSTRKVSNGGSISSSNHSNSSSTRSSASSNSSAKKIGMGGPPLPGMVSCQICGRNFNNDRIAKHEVICRKTTTKKRKVFDSTKQRVEGTEVSVYVKTSAKIARKKPEPPKKKSNWRKTHEEFIQAIRSAKEMQRYVAQGGKLSDLPPPPVSENPDFVQCPHCGRRFNESAAARHIPKCANYEFNKPKPRSNAVLGKKRF